MRWIIAICLMFPTLSIAQDIGDSFQHLSVLEVDQTFVGPIRIYYNPKIAKVLNKLDQEIYDEVGIKEIEAIQTRLSEDDKNIYVVRYGEGASVDPHFSIYRTGQDPYKPIWSALCTTIIIPGNGSIYIAGHTNNMFNMRRKFAFRNGKFSEVRQAFYYVGLDTVTNADLTLYATPEPTPAGHEIVARVPKDSKVLVVLNRGDHYLIKTPFGLLGWMKLPDAPLGRKPTIEGLYVAGD